MTRFRSGARNFPAEGRGGRWAELGMQIFSLGANSAKNIYYCMVKKKSSKYFLHGEKKLKNFSRPFIAPPLTRFNK